LFDNKLNNENSSEISVQDILNEMNSEHIMDDASLNLDEILAEFSDAGFVKINDRIKEEIVLEETSVPEQSENVEQVKLVKNIVRPWENGTYGDMKIPEQEKDSKRNRKRKKVSEFAETFDTFTRSDIFEEKNIESKKETRTVEQIIKENSKLSKLLGVRCVFLFVFGILSCYLSFAHPLNLFLPKFIAYTQHPFRFLFLIVLFQVFAMLLSVDVVSKGLDKLLHFKPNAESAIAFSSFATLIHSLSIMIVPRWSGWLPYSCVSVVTLFFAIFGKWINARALCRICKTVKAAQRPSMVYVERIYDELHIIKQEKEDAADFISHLNDVNSSDVFWSYLSPVLIIASVVFSFIASICTNRPEQFFWTLSGISSVSVSFFTGLSFTLPFSVAAKRLSSVGAAISGWYSITNMSKKANVVITDHDLFPKGTVTLHGLKILGNFSLEQTVCYVASIVAETKSGLTDVFSDLLKSQYGVRTTVSNVRYHEAGGLEATIGQDTVYVGTAGFMLRSGVKLNEGTNVKNAVFIAINKQPAGVFNINYKGGADVERALHMLIKKRVPVILAVRDFNLLPTMVEHEFELKDGVLEYPEVEQRIDLSAEGQYVVSDPTALITRSGLYPLAESILTAKKLRSTVIKNVIFSALSSLIGIMFMFYLMFIQKPILVTPHTVIIYMLLWCIPAYLLSIRVNH